MSLESDIPLERREIPDAAKLKIASTYWDAQWPSQEVPTQVALLEPYFDYFDAQTSIALHDLGRYVSVRSHNDVIAIVELLKRRDSRQDMVPFLMNSSAAAGLDMTNEQFEASIDFAVRLVTMVEVGWIPNTYTGPRPLRWESGCFNEFFESQFPVHGELSSEQVKLESIFMACNLHRIAGIRIRWTTNLADHLRLQNNDSEVLIFGCVSFLRCCENW